MCYFLPREEPAPLPAEICSQLGLCVSQRRVKLGVCSSLSFLSTAFSGKHLTAARFPEAVFDFFTHFAPEPQRHHGNKKITVCTAGFQHLSARFLTGT